MVTTMNTEIRATTIDLGGEDRIQIEPMDSLNGPVREVIDQLRDMFLG